MSAMGYSPPADVTGRVIFVGLGYPEDYAKYAAGQQGYLALIMRGVIPFAFKAQYAFEAGAAGAIVINNRHVEGAFPALSAGTSSVAIGNITLEDGIGILQRLYPEGIPELGDDLTSNVTVRARLKVDTERNVAPSPQVIGTLKGTHPNLGTLYMTSGLDSYGIAGRANPDGSVICPYSYVSGALEGSPGANDNASGVAVMVEAARVLTTGHRMKASIKFVAFGGGETGASGSVAYALAHREELMTAALGDINLDMLGVGKYLLLGNLSSPPTLARFGLAKAQAMGIDVIDATGWMPQSSNQAAFEWSGVPALQFLRFIGEEPHPVNFVDDPNFHLPTDTADKIDPQLLEIAGELASAIAYDYAKNPERRERKAALESGECEPPCNGK
jgi:aminopeptidase YwaD